MDENFGQPEFQPAPAIRRRSGLSSTQAGFLFPRLAPQEQPTMGIRQRAQVIPYHPHPLESQAIRVSRQPERVLKKCLLGQKCFYSYSL